MNTNIIQRVKTALTPDEMANTLSEFLAGRNVAPDATFDRYVINAMHIENGIIVELDDGTFYEISIRRTK